MLINRGSQIFAEGSPTAPIIFTAFSDAVTNTAGANDVSLWGGIVINGNGITNNCTDAERAADQCHVVSEGQPSNYGGDDNADNSGVLRYVIVRHTGFEMDPGDELNGITFNAGGSGTTVENVQATAPSTTGSSSLAARSTSRRPSCSMRATTRSTSRTGTPERYRKRWSSTTSPTATAASRATTSARRAPTAAGTRYHATVGPDDPQPDLYHVERRPGIGLGTHGDSEGPLARFGALIHIEDGIVYAGYGVVENGCRLERMLEIESDVSLDAAASGTSTIRAGSSPARRPSRARSRTATRLTEWALGANPSTNGANYSFNTGNVIIADSDNANVSVLEAGTFFTSTSPTDELGNPISITPVTPVDEGGKLGAVLASDDWTTPWAFGLREENADEPLWFAPSP